jgi:drug/metabolite transporter (DMT)-like permease
MERIIEYFGRGLLAVLGAAAVYGIYISCISPGGEMYTAVLNFMNSICG